MKGDRPAPLQAGAVLLVVLLAGCTRTAPAAPEGPIHTAAGSCFQACATSVLADPWWGWEPSIAIDPDDPLHIVVGVHDDPWGASPYYVEAAPSLALTPGLLRLSSVVSFDGGRTWERDFLPHAGDAPVGSQWALMCNQGDPVVLFGPTGTLHYFGVGIGCSDGLLAAATNYLFMATSHDGGRAWSEPTIIAQGSGAALQFHDKPWAAIDPKSGRMALAWTAFEANQAVATLYVSLSDDGHRWTPPEAVARHTWLLPPMAEDPLLGGEFANFYVHPVFDTAGKLHIGFTGCAGSCVKVATRTGTGPVHAWSFKEIGSAPETDGWAAAFHPGRNVISMAVAYEGPHAGRIYIAYHGQGNGLDVMLAWSDDGGASWGGPFVPHHQQAGDQFHAWMAVDQDVHLLFMDRLPGSRQVQATYARYDPHNGTGFSVPLESTWDPNPVDAPGGPLFGHYEGLDARDGVVAMAWTRVTSPKSGQEPFSAGLGFDRDIHVAVLDGATWITGAHRG